MVYFRVKDWARVEVRGRPGLGEPGRAQDAKRLRSVLEGMLKAGVVIRAEVGWDAVVRPSFVVRATTDNATNSTDLIAEAQAAITGNGLGPYSHFVECHRSRTIPATDIASLRPLLETALRWAEQC